MSQKNKKAKLCKVHEKIAGVLSQLDQIEDDRSELCEAVETLEIELSELKKKESKLLTKIKP